MPDDPNEAGEIADLLALLGLGHLTAGPEEELQAAPVEHTAHGLGLGAPPSELAELARLAEREPTAIDQRAALPSLWARAGLRIYRVQEAPHVLAVGVEPGDEVSVHLVDGPAEAAEAAAAAQAASLAGVERAGERVWLDLRALPARGLVLLAPDERGLWVGVAEDGGARLRPIEPRAPAALIVEPWPDPAPILAAVEECLTVTPRDAWLDAEVRERLERKSLLEAFAGLGLLARLRRPPAEREARRAHIAALLGGRHVPELDRERSAARKLPPEHLAAVEDEALAASGRLWEELEGVAREPAPDLDPWRAALSHALVERDDLEGVRVLLGASGRGERLVRGLRQVDRLGREVLAAIPRIPRFPSPSSRLAERLRRAAAASPEGWWTEPIDWLDRGRDRGRE